VISRDFAHTAFWSSRSAGPDARWKAGPRVRVDALRKGDRVLVYTGIEEVYERRDGALSGCHHMRSGNVYAGCAEVVPIGKE
jgi:hypothetical protein